MIGSNKPLEPALPFIGRTREAACLARLHAERKHVLILGPPGVGKSRLVDHLKGALGLLICPESEQLGAICESLEAGLELHARGLRLPERKQRVIRALTDVNRTVVFDGVGWTTPKLSSFLESVMERVPVWIVTRSDHPWDIGHFWTCLVRFERVRLKPFHRSETRALVSAAVAAGLIPRGALNVVEWLHGQAKGSPRVLHGLLETLAAGDYDLSNPWALRRLKLDRRIHELFPMR